MRKHNGGYLYTPSDLVEFLSSPFATWMTRRFVDDPSAVTPDADPPELLSLREQAQRHEQACLAQLRAEGHDVYEVPSSGDRVQLTRQAMQAGHDVIFHAVLAQADFWAQAAFLVRVDATSVFGDYAYEVWETKVARVVKPESLIQLCCHADLLEALQGCRPKQIHIVLGNGERQPFRTNDYVYYYRALKRACVSFVEQAHQAHPLLPNLGGNNGRWQSQAEALLESADHLCRVATITQQQMDKLQDAGITTMQALAETSQTHIARLDDAIFARLREQARLQIASAKRLQPAYQIVTPLADDPRKGLAVLPPASRLDVYFDMEGYPLTEGGLEYLFGAIYVEPGEARFEPGEARFIDWWAHDAQEEKRAFEGFIDWVFARWQADSSLHIYHYANYEVAALRRLMGRYGTREAEVDTLLRQHVFVDLYTIVRQGVQVGEPCYSIKNLEHLYREQRAGAVTQAIDSIVFYDRWLASGESGRWQESPLLQDIRDYNRDDCESTWQLTEWLRQRQYEAGISWLPPGGGVLDAEQALESLSEPNPRHALAERLLAEIPHAAAARTPEEDRWHLQEMFGHVVEFHRREEKPLWWATFERHAMTEQELVEDLDCLGGLERASDPPVRIKNSLGFWYVFDPDQDTKLTAGKTCFFAHDLDITTDIQVLDRDTGRVCLKFGPKKIKQLDGQQPPRRLSLIPNERVSAQVIAEAIEQAARSWQDAQQLSPALKNFLLREPPRLQHTPDTIGTLVSLMSLMNAGEDVATDVQADLGSAAVRTVSALDHSTLCIQGPPGAGKTTTAAVVILALLADGKRVGITSNSHAAILNLMHKCSDMQDGHLACIKVGGSEDAPFFAQCLGAQYVKSVRDALPHLSQVGLIGGTAWTFSAPGMRDKLDYLFVDEAGQVSVANLIGMAASTQNIVLLGDQMQLGQPIQGAHPGDSGQSSLAYLLQGQATIPNTLGLFLGTTWRLHPQLCDFISDTMYDGRLQAAAQTAQRIVRVPHIGTHVIRQEAGLVFVPVQHAGNSQGSDEEVAMIQEIVAELLGRELTDENGQAVGILGFEDIVCVAPYNMQVRKLQAALGPQARVGSVDKFQGQEAAVVIVSMCASQGESSPRGIEFLFNRNRLNVALSRARSLAIVVANPGLSQTRCSTIANMALVNLFCRVMEEGSPGD